MEPMKRFEYLLFDKDFLESQDYYIKVEASPGFKQAMELFSNGATKFLGHTVWLAGGAVLDLLQDGTIKDYDVFGDSIKSLNNYRDQLQLDGFKCYHSSDVVKCFSKGEVKVQLIYREHRITAGPFSCINEFPFHLNQFAFDGEFIYTTLDAINSMNNKIITANNIESRNAVESIKRLNRYGEKGYIVDAKSIIRISDTIRNLSEDEYEEQVQYIKRTTHGGGY